MKNKNITTEIAKSKKDSLPRFSLYFILTIACTVIFSCKEAQNPYIPTPDIFIRNFTNTIPNNTEVELELREILNTGTLFCESSFQNKKIELNGENDNIFVQDLEQFSSTAYFSVYKQKIKNKSDIFIVKARCCPMGPCYTTYFFQKQTSGLWKLFDTIPGEVIDYKKTKDQTIIKLQDDSLTALTYVGFWKDNTFNAQFAYRYMNVEIPTAFTQTQKTLTENKEFNLLKKPRDYHIDNLSFRVKALSNTNIYILSESEKHYFVMLNASPEQVQNILENFKDERENLIPQIQGLGSVIKKTKDLEKLLNRTFYNIGWIEKF